MKRSQTVFGLAVLACLLAIGALLVHYRAVELNAQPAAAAAPPSVPPPVEEASPSADVQGFLYGRIATVDGAVHEGRLRFGSNEEAFWGDYFNGAKKENPWLDNALLERLPKERSPVEIFGVKILEQERPIDTERRFLARFGEIKRIEAHGRDVLVTLKNGTVVDCDLFGASDFDDGLRVWGDGEVFVDLDSDRIATIEFLAPPATLVAPARLHGTVRTNQGSFTGFVQWDREECVGSDTLDGHSPEGERKLRFDTIRSIARDPEGNSLVTLLDGNEVTLSGTNDVNGANRGVFVDDARFGRVLVSWDAFERADFSPEGSGPAYAEFPAGERLRGSVTTRDGKQRAGKLVYDLDESETTGTLDAPFRGVDYRIPFGLIASIVVPDGDSHAALVLHNGEKLELDRESDLGRRNAGMLVFAGQGGKGEYVAWADVARVDFDRPAAMYPPLPDR